ncbi:DnaB-like helicase N-terminal domain-containing protein, partial [Yaniella sp.]
MDTANGVSANPRTPPQDLDAERSVLGAMMLSTDAIAEVSEIIRPEDFYSPGHELVYT